MEAGIGAEGAGVGVGGRRITKTGVATKVGGVGGLAGGGGLLTLPAGGEEDRR
jgi:hypothetical protein